MIEYLPPQVKNMGKWAALAKVSALQMLFIHLQAKKCKHSESHKDNFNVLQGYFQIVFIAFTVDDNVDYYIEV